MKVDVARLLVALGIDARRRGREWWARCPLHSERTPSWSMRDDVSGNAHGVHHCLGCGAKGGPVHLVAEIRDLTYDEAAEWIAAQGLATREIAPLNVTVRVVGRTPPAPFKLPLGLGSGPLERWPSPVRRYVESRGITARQVTRWGMLYATEDRLGGRVVFPIADEEGRLQSYSARSFDGGEPKYLTPKREEHPNSAALFGAATWSGRRERVVVVEGAIDALACERALDGAPVAALGGSEPSRDQLLALSSFERVLVVTDPDAAGDKAADAVIGALARWRRVRRVRLPDGQDAASMPPEELVRRLGDGGSRVDDDRQDARA